MLTIVRYLGNKRQSWLKICRCVNELHDVGGGGEDSGAVRGRRLGTRRFLYDGRFDNKAPALREPQPVRVVLNGVSSLGDPYFSISKLRPK